MQIYQIIICVGASTLIFGFFFGLGLGISRSHRKDVHEKENHKQFLIRYK